MNEDELVSEWERQHESGESLWGLVNAYRQVLDYELDHCSDGMADPLDVWVILRETLKQLHRLDHQDN